MKENNDDRARERIVERIVALAADRHANDMRTASGVLSEFFSKDPKDTEFYSSGEEGVWDTGFGMMVFAGTMQSLFEGTEEVLLEIADIPRGARRRIAKVQKEIKRRHIKELKSIRDEPDDNISE